MNAPDPNEQNASIITRPRADFGVRITGHPIAVEGTLRMLDAYTRTKQDRDALLAVAEAVDALWRKHGFGDDDAESEPIWDALQAALTNALRSA